MKNKSFIQSSMVLRMSTCFCLLMGISCDVSIYGDADGESTTNEVKRAPFVSISIHKSSPDDIVEKSEAAVYPPLLRTPKNTPEAKDGIKIEKIDFYSNVREYIKGNILFRAHPIGRGNNFSSLRIGTPNHPYDGEPPLVVRFPNGVEMNLAETSVEQLKKQMTSVSPAIGGFVDIGRGDEKDVRTPWPEGAERLQIVPGWLFHVHDNRILSFHVYYRDVKWDGWKGQKPAIGTPGSGILYEFPLTQEEIIRVFRKPDKIREYFQQ